MKRVGLVVVGTLSACAAFGDLADFVDPFTGTAGTGHTHPAACVPFGMVQAGPDTGCNEPAFEVAGRHGEWKPAKLLGVSENGAVTGTVLTVRSEEVKEPVMVRYLGRNRSMGTLFNEVSLPLGPFQDQEK